MRAIRGMHEEQQAERDPGQRLVGLGKHAIQAWSQILAEKQYCDWVVET